METVLSGRGTRARFDGTRLRIVRDGTTWTVPVQAIASVEESAGGAVRVVLAGDPSRARHGLGGSVALSGPNARAAGAFAGHVRTALGRVTPAADGHALVTVVRPEPAGAGGGLGGTARRAVRVGAALAGYATLLAVIGVTGPRSTVTAAVSLSFGGLLGILGGVPLWRVGRRFHAMAVLRRRGIGVVARIDGRVKIWSKGASLWEFPCLSYTTVDGEKYARVPSRVSMWAWGEVRPTVEILYDPEFPRRAGVPPTVGFALRSVVLGLLGLVPMFLFVLAVLANTPLLDL
ncbi:DUF3592 domain-containing protein [Streptomyces exfoliatus]|uniref:DUF3592 domain-containing protein n=1 Tax=Streptomyces exfoliatus TaxID=1905 RepID=UPI0004C79C09|nr:DUF3592 domain-containing protein [Streptomyces exfoliatus]